MTICLKLQLISGYIHIILYMLLFLKPELQLFNTQKLQSFYMNDWAQRQFLALDLNEADQFVTGYSMILRKRPYLEHYQNEMEIINDISCLTIQILLNNCNQNNHENVNVNEPEIDLDELIHEYIAKIESYYEWYQSHRPYICYYCNKQFTKSFALLQHLNQTHHLTKYNHNDMDKQFQNGYNEEQTPFEEKEKEKEKKNANMNMEPIEYEFEDDQFEDAEDDNEDEDEDEDENGKVMVMDHICYLLISKLMNSIHGFYYNESYPWHPDHIISKYINNLYTINNFFNTNNIKHTQNFQPHQQYQQYQAFTMQIKKLLVESQEKQKEKEQQQQQQEITENSDESSSKDTNYEYNQTQHNDIQSDINASPSTQTASRSDDDTHSLQSKMEEEYDESHEETFNKLSGKTKRAMMTAHYIARILHSYLKKFHFCTECDSEYINILDHIYIQRI